MFIDKASVKCKSLVLWLCCSRVRWKAEIQVSTPVLCFLPEEPRVINLFITAKIAEILLFPSYWFLLTDKLYRALIYIPFSSCYQFIYGLHLEQLLTSHVDGDRSTDKMSCLWSSGTDYWRLGCWKVPFICTVLQTDKSHLLNFKTRARGSSHKPSLLYPDQKKGGKNPKTWRPVSPRKWEAPLDAAMGCFV